ncbi:MAG: DUF11 domain-containing protein, partial [Propionibacteriaceae bacterium]|nr:DUF11 domain-containing protein [Propionibacteriaceae bacterium]
MSRSTHVTTKWAAGLSSVAVMFGLLAVVPPLADADQGGEPDLSISYSRASVPGLTASGLLTASPGQAASVHFQVWNYSADPATGVEFSLPLPAGLDPAAVTIYSISGGTSYDPAVGVWQIGDLAPSTSVSLWIDFVVPAGQTGAVLTFTGTITRANGQAVGPRANRTMQVSLSFLLVNPGDGYAKPAIADAASVPAGASNYKYTVRVDPVGDGAVTGVRAVHPVPDHLTLIDATASQGDYDPVTGLWDIGDLSKAATLTLAVSVDPSITASTDLPVALEITDVNGRHRDDGELRAEGSIHVVPPVDLTLTAAADPATAEPGDTIVQTLTLGCGNTYSIWGTLIDVTLPGNATLVSWDESGAPNGTFNPATGRWTAGPVSASGRPVTLTLTYTVDANAAVGDQVTTTAEIVGVIGIDLTGQPTATAV